jgi:hydroxyethylthiazole kinase-like uncharacterized protein yjeF
VTRVPVLTPDEVRAVEARAAQGGVSLMALAGRACAEASRELAADTGAPILVVAGPGNNGGDAWVAAAELAESFHRVVLFDVTGTIPKAEEARKARERFLARGGKVVRQWPDGLGPALIVDGLLGLGLARDVETPFAEVIARMNASGRPILAIDVPSGLDSGSGRIRGDAVRATRTLTFLAHKVGLHTAAGLDCRGDLRLDDLGAAELAASGSGGELVTAATVRGWLEPRRRDSHKGDHGSVAVIGGNRGMVGAALLAARAALLCGAGKVRVGLLSPDAPPVDLVHPELMLSPVDDALAAEVIVAGPGAGQSPSATSVSMFERTVLPQLCTSSKVLVLDADALNAIAYSEALREEFSKARRAATILTPHPAEAARLLGRSTREIQAQRLESALEIARRFHAHVVLKGAGSICAFPDGRWSVNGTGNPGLAAAGSGDVLAGIIGALLAQKLEPARALQYAVCLHGAAADSLVARGVGPVGLTASEIALEARSLLNEWASGSATD